MCETNPNEEEITRAVNETIALFEYYLNTAKYREKPTSKHVSEHQEDAIRGIVNSAS